MIIGELGRKVLRGSSTLHVWTPSSISSALTLDVEFYIVTMAFALLASLSGAPAVGWRLKSSMQFRAGVKPSSLAFEEKYGTDGH